MCERLRLLHTQCTHLSETPLKNPRQLTKFYNAVFNVFLYRKWFCEFSLYIDGWYLIFIISCWWKSTYVIPGLYWSSKISLIELSSFCQADLRLHIGQDLSFFVHSNTPPVLLFELQKPRGSQKCLMNVNWFYLSFSLSEGQDWGFLPDEQWQ